MADKTETPAPIAKPTPGRIVWFHPAGLGLELQALPAIVTHVCDPSEVQGKYVVNLCVFDQNGVPLAGGRRRVKHISDWPKQEEMELVNKDFWTWMPYQTGQAQKTEDLAGKLESRIAVLEATVNTLSEQLAKKKSN